LAHHELLGAVKRFRHRMPRLGTRKLLYLLDIIQISCFDTRVVFL
jgi:hypothetical protein